MEGEAGEQPAVGCAGAAGCLQLPDGSREGSVGSVTDDNGVGFAGVNGEFLSSLAKQYQSRGRLSEKQMQFLHKKMPKHAKQLWKAAAPPSEGGGGAPVEESVGRRRGK